MRVAAALTECLKAFKEGDGDHIILVLGTASSASDVAPLLRRCFTHELKAGEAVNCPTAWEICSILEKQRWNAPIFVHFILSTFTPPVACHSTIMTSWAIIMVGHWDNPMEEMGGLEWVRGR